MATLGTDDAIVSGRKTTTTSSRSPLNHDSNMMEKGKKLYLQDHDHNQSNDRQGGINALASPIFQDTSVYSFRSYSLNARPPEMTFGPKAYMLGIKNGMVLQDPADQQLGWHTPATSILVVKKDMDDTVTEEFKAIVRWLLEERKLKVYIEESVKHQPGIVDDHHFRSTLQNLLTINIEIDDYKLELVDLVVCLGGDGTFLHASSLFQQNAPPVIAFSLGTLGFLTKFKISDFKSVIDKVLDDNPRVALRNRLTCEIHFSKNKTVEKHAVLNEIVVDRGPSAFLTNLNIICNERHITNIEGDGLIIATPTGSTAYSLASGGCMVHPCVPSILFTPICPHALSSRPVILPAGVQLKIQTSENARGPMWISVDGRSRQQLSPDDYICITTSIHPLACICANDPVEDWFISISDCLHWNMRHRQR